MNVERTAAHVLRDVFDYVAPLLRLNLPELALYLYLLRHTQLEGQRSAHLTWNQLSAALHTSRPAIRQRVYRLARKGCLIVHDQTGRHSGNRLEVAPPQELILGAASPAPASRARKGAADVHRAEVQGASSSSNFPSLAERRFAGAITFRVTPALRFGLWQREHGRCFYCSRKLATPLRAPRLGVPQLSCRRSRRELRSRTAHPSRCWPDDAMWLDHVVPISQGGSHGLENVVAACRSCNRSKRIAQPEVFLQRLFRAKKISKPQYRYKLAAIRRIRAGRYPLPAAA
jgi:5-methylcytosine-specific restriction endonuclease McrA